MTSVSWSGLAAALTVLALPLSACTGACPNNLCIQDFAIYFDGGFDPDKTYQIELSQVSSNGEASPLLSCTRFASFDGVGRMDCQAAAAGTVFQADPASIRFPDQTIKKVRIAISKEGVLVDQRDYAVKVAQTGSAECGFCPVANVHVDVPVRPLWGEQGRHIFGVCGSESMGTSAFEATRDQLSVEQLRLLSDAQAVPNPKASCPKGEVACFVYLDLYDRSSTEWAVRASDRRCTDVARATPEQLLSFETFEPFRLSLGCWFGVPLVEAATAAAAATGPLPVLSRSVVCGHGLRPAPGTTIRVGLDVPAADVSRAHHLEIVCSPFDNANPITMQVLDPAGKTVLVRGAGGGANDSTCQALDFTFPAAGTYLLEIAASSKFKGEATLVYK